MLIVAGGNGSDCCSQIGNNRPLQILWLKTFTSPAPGTGTMKSECTTDPTIAADTCQQRVDLLDGCLCSTEPELERPPYRRWQIFMLSKLFFDSLSIEALAFVALLLEPGYKLSDLIDFGNCAVGDPAELGVYFRSC